MLRRASASLRIPIQTTEQELRAALTAIDRANVGNSDPAVQEAREHLSAALAAVGGSNGLRRRRLLRRPASAGLDAALAFELQLDAAGQQVDAAVRQAGQLADVMQQVADGARLVNGLSTVAGGEQELAAALGQARDGVAAVQPQLDALAGGAQSLLSTGGELLDASGARAAPLLSQLRQGLGAASTRIGTVRDQLRERRGLFEPLRTCTRSNGIHRDSSARAI